MGQHYGHDPHYDARSNYMQQQQQQQQQQFRQQQQNSYSTSYSTSTHGEPTYTTSVGYTFIEPLQIEFSLIDFDNYRVKLKGKMHQDVLSILNLQEGSQQIKPKK